MERKSIVLNGKFTKISEQNNKGFTLAKCYVCAEGKNRNKSIIPHESIVNALPTLSNIPVVANLFVNEDGEYSVGGHDVEVAVNKDGGAYFKPLTVPFGVVPEREDEYKFEDVKDPDGTVRTYVTCPVILWTGRYPELAEAYLGEEKMFSQSMEIDVNEYEKSKEDKNYVEIHDFSFSGLCLLGADIEPCFPEAKVVQFSINDDEFSILFNEFKKELALCFATEKGEEKMGEEKIIKKPEEDEVKEENNPSEIQKNDEKEIVVVVDKEDGEKPEGDDPERKPNKKCNSSFKEKYETLCEIMSCKKKKVCGDSGECNFEVNYYLNDFDDNYVYFIEEEYDFINDVFACKKRRCKYSFDEALSSYSVDIDSVEEMYEKWITKEEADEIEAMRARCSALEEEKKNRDEKERCASYDEAAKEFADMEGSEEYQKVYENRYSYETIEDMKNAFYIIRGKYSLVQPVKKQTVTAEPVVLVGEAKKVLTAREKLHEAYGKR